MQIGTRSLVFFLVVIAALIVAIWPRSGSTGITRVPEHGSAAGDRVYDASEATAAADARLQPCPEPVDTPPSGMLLGGVLARCLGSAETVDLGAALSGEATLINVWASWCGPCKQEIPVLAAFASEPDAIRVVGINVQDTPLAAIEFLRQAGAGYPSFIDSGAVQHALAAPSVLPLSFLVDRDGSVERITTPAVFDDTRQIRTAIAAMSR